MVTVMAYGVLGFLLARGVACVLWQCSRWLMEKHPPQHTQAVAIQVLFQQDMPSLDEELWWYRMRFEGWDQADLLVVDCGMSSQAREMCEIWEREHPWVHVCRPEQLCDLLMELTGMR